MQNRCVSVVSIVFLESVVVHTCPGSLLDFRYSTASSYKFWFSIWFVVLKSHVYLKIVAVFLSEYNGIIIYSNKILENEHPASTKKENVAVANKCCHIYDKKKKTKRNKQTKNRWEDSDINWKRFCLGYLHVVNWCTNTKDNYGVCSLYI